MAALSAEDVSVVVATYNGARHIAQQLHSILEQTWPPIEIVVCDDGSTDDTTSVVEALAAVSAVPIHVIRNSRTLGFSDNFLNGASLTRGRYVSFCDQDDIWRADKLELTLSAMREHRAHLSAHQVDLVDSDGVFLRTDTQGITRSRVVPALSQNPWRNFFGFSITIDRQLLTVLPASARGCDTHSPGLPLSHDRWLCFLGLSLGRSVYIAEPLARYRQHAKQLYGSREVPAEPIYRLAHKLRELRAGMARVAQNADLYASIAGHREQLLQGADWPDQEAVRRSTRRWHRLASLYATRRSLHHGQRILKFDMLTRLILAGAYFSKRRSGLGLRALAQDAVSFFVSAPTNVA